LLYNTPGKEREREIEREKGGGLYAVVEWHVYEHVLGNHVPKLQLVFTSERTPSLLSLTPM
jgi:hypothetical protein